MFNFTPEQLKELELTEEEVNKEAELFARTLKAYEGKEVEL